MSARIGVNTWVWHSPLTDAKLDRLAPRVAGAGFDVLELPVETPGEWDPGRARDLLDEHGLEATVCAAMAPGRDLARGDAAAVAATQAYLRAVIDVASVVGSAVVGGPIYAPTGDTWQLAPAERRAVLARVAEGLRPTLEQAATLGVTLAIEPLNRYETSLVNTTEQGLELLDQLPAGCPAGLLVDTFHLNIEERDLTAAVRSAAGRIAHVQASATDRGAPGADHLDWVGFRDAVRAAGYDGPWVIESFTPDNATIARAASIWRPLARSQDVIAFDGLAHLRALLD